MPPHCDTMDGPVVASAQRALERGEVKEVFPWIPEDAEEEVKKAFEKTLIVRKMGGKARELADYWFWETCVRVHRMGEGAPYTGIKPAGQEVSPAVEAADRSMENESVDELVKILKESAEDNIREKFEETLQRKRKADESVEAGREWVRSYVEFIHLAKAIYDSSQGEHGHIEFE